MSKNSCPAQTGTWQPQLAFSAATTNFPLEPTTFCPHPADFSQASTNFGYFPADIHEDPSDKRPNPPDFRQNPTDSCSSDQVNLKSESRKPLVENRTRNQHSDVSFDPFSIARLRRMKAQRAKEEPRTPPSFALLASEDTSSFILQHFILPPTSPPFGWRHCRDTDTPPPFG